MATAMLTLPSTYVRRYDPTRTIGLRNAWARETSRRFDKLAASVRATVALRDYFGLERNIFQSSTGFQGHYASVTSESVRDFLSWFDNEAMNIVLESSPEPWTNLYARSAYQRGLIRGRQELIRVGMKIPKLNGVGEGLVAFNNPSHLKKVGLLYVRVYNELKGAVAAMSQQVGRTLTQEATSDIGPDELASSLIRAIMGSSTSSPVSPARRGELIARTETIRAHHVASIQEYRNWDIGMVRFLAEEVNDVACRCKNFQGKEFSLDEAEGMIPVHPLCHCMALPVSAIN